MNILYVNSLEANNKELTRQLTAANVLIAEQNKLAKERQEWALHTNEVIRSLNQQLAATEEKRADLEFVWNGCEQELENCKSERDQLRQQVALLRDALFSIAAREMYPVQIALDALAAIS